jgi:hypothetical protein
VGYSWFFARQVPWPGSFEFVAARTGVSLAFQHAIPQTEVCGYKNRNSFVPVRSPEKADLARLGSVFEQIV